jgi:hypothetical protein
LTLEQSTIVVTDRRLYRGNVDLKERVSCMSPFDRAPPVHFEAPRAEALSRRFNFGVVGGNTLSSRGREVSNPYVILTKVALACPTLVQVHITERTDSWTALFQTGVHLGSSEL